MIISPCISICKTDPKTGYCYGCGRSTEEKIVWKDEKTSGSAHYDMILNKDDKKNQKVSSDGLALV